MHRSNMCFSMSDEAQDMVSYSFNLVLDVLLLLPAKIFQTVERRELYVPFSTLMSP